jgi:hypothetical protein
MGRGLKGLDEVPSLDSLFFRDKELRESRGVYQIGAILLFRLNSEYVFLAIERNEMALIIVLGLALLINAAHDFLQVLVKSIHLILLSPILPILGHQFPLVSLAFNEWTFYFIFSD